MELMDPVMKMFRGWWSSFTRDAKMRMPLWSAQRRRQQIADDWREEAYEAERDGNPKRARYIADMANRLEAGEL